MLLTNTTAHNSATAPGSLLHKSPARLQEFELSNGKASLSVGRRCTDPKIGPVMDAAAQKQVQKS